MGGTPRRIADAYLEVERWQRAAAGRELSEAQALEDHIAEAKAQIVELQHRVEEMGHALVAAHKRAAAVAQARDERLYETIFDVITEQARALELRAIAVRDAELQQGELWLERILDAGLIDTYKEYVDYKQRVEPGLGAFPDSYRGVVRGHHQEVKAALRDWFDDQSIEPGAVDAPTLRLDVVFSVDEPEEDLAVVMAVLPVASEVASRWASRQDGLAMAVAARVVEGMYKAASGLRQPAAQVLYGGHRGALALEMELRGDPADIAAAMAGGIQAAVDRAPELAAAEITARVRAVPIEHLLPPKVFTEPEATHG